MNVTTSRHRRESSAQAARRGTTLIELVTVITVSSVLLSILTGLIIQMTRLEGITRGRIAESMAIGRLSDQFRQDVHASSEVRLSAGNAESANPDQPPKLAVLLGDSIQVDYSQSGHGIDRVMRRRQVVMARDRYRLPDQTHASWSELEVGAVRLVRTDVVREPSDRQVFSFVAEVGRHRRAESATTATDTGDQTE